MLLIVVILIIVLECLLVNIDGFGYILCLSFVDVDFFNFDLLVRVWEKFIYVFMLV